MERFFSTKEAEPARVRGTAILLQSDFFVERKEFIPRSSVAQASACPSEAKSTCGERLLMGPSALLRLLQHLLDP